MTSQASQYNGISVNMQNSFPTHSAFTHSLNIKWYLFNLFTYLFIHLFIYLFIYFALKDLVSE